MTVIVHVRVADLRNQLSFSVDVPSAVRFVAALEYLVQVFIDPVHYLDPRIVPMQPQTASFENLPYHALRLIFQPLCHVQLIAARSFWRIIDPLVGSESKIAHANKFGVGDTDVRCGFCCGLG